LRRRSDVSLEQDKAPRAFGRDELALFSSKFGPGDADYEGFHGHSGPSERFPAKACPGLNPGWAPVRVKKTPQDKKLTPPLRFNRNGDGSSAETREGSRKGPLILWDEALSAGRLERGAQLQRFLSRAERTDHGAVNDPLVGQIGTLDHRIVSS
jgi:hypothetical protein